MKIVGQPVEAFHNKLYAGMVQVPGYHLFNFLFPPKLDHNSVKKRHDLRKATLPWPGSTPYDRLMKAMKEN